MIFSNPWGHLEGLEEIEELSIASIHALTIFDLENIKELLKHYWHVSFPTPKGSNHGTFKVESHHNITKLVFQLVVLDKI